MKIGNRIDTIFFAILFLAFLASHLYRLQNGAVTPWEGFETPDDVLIAHKDLALKHT